MEFARNNNLHERPIGEILQELGVQYLGLPYLTGPLDGFGREVLVCRLDGFDCFTFLEAVLAAARGVAVQDYSYESYVERTREQRYRDGVMTDYCSRLHYYTEWISDNEEKGLVNNITPDIGGIRLDKEYSFMSEHRESYPRLAENDSMYQCISQVEDQLNRTLEYFYIPQDSIHVAYDKMLAGDLIATSTDIEGLDVTHTGMVYRGDDGSTGLLHASTSGGVKISPDLEEYVQGVKSQTGIIVARARR
jgi:cell wall-associated NlpC family hydrolase